MLSNRDIVRKVKGAFLPMRCAVEVWDYQSRFLPPKLRLRVFHPGVGVVESQKIALKELRNEHALDCVLREMRSNLETQGFTLN